MLRINHEIAWVCFGTDCWPWDTFTSIVPWQFNCLLVALIINLVIIIIKSALRQLLAIVSWGKIVHKLILLCFRQCIVIHHLKHTIIEHASLSLWSEREWGFRGWSSPPKEVARRWKLGRISVILLRRLSTWLTQASLGAYNLSLLFINSFIIWVLYYVH